MVPVLLGGHNSNSFWLMAITYYVLYSFELSITYYVLVLSIQENFCCAASVLSIATFLHSHIHILGGAMINAVLIQCKLTKLFKNFGACLIKVFLLTGFILLLIHGLSYQLFLKHQCNEKYSITKGSSDAVDMPVNISHIIFALAGFAKGWQDRGPYVDLWWRPNLTRGHVWLDRAPTEYQWPTTSPPFRVSEDASRFKEYDRRNNPFTNRMARMILETFNEGFEGARWFVKADDDSVLFVDNLVELLAKFDHNGYYYIGGNSECIAQNDQHSFNMGFGGGGYAVSYPLAKVLVKNLDGCIKRYPTLYGEDSIMQSCIAELGVPFTREPGFHQVSSLHYIASFHPCTLCTREQGTQFVGLIQTRILPQEEVAVLLEAQSATLNIMLAKRSSLLPWASSCSTFSLNLCQFPGQVFPGGHPSQNFLALITHLTPKSPPVFLPTKC